MKKILLFLLLIPSFVFANDIYKYSGFNLSGDLVGEGSVSIDSKDKNFLDINSNVYGDTKSYVFQTRAKNVKGFNLWDVKALNSNSGISVFTLQIDPTIKFDNNYSSTKVETLDKRHPFFNDHSWVFDISFEGYETLSFDNKVQVQTIHLSTKGERFTGTGHCMFGGVGVVNVESWYDKVSGKLLKQELTKRHCKPNENTVLSKEILTLKI